MLFTCLPEGARIPGRFPGPAHARGKWFTVDIHCHVTSVKAAAMVEGNEAVSRWYLETQANARSREINRQNGVRTRVQGTSAEQRIADMDLMGIDIQAISPAPRQTYYGADPELGLATARTLNDEIADIVGRHPDRFTGLGTIPLQAPELAIAEFERLHKSLGMRGIEIMTHVAGEDLSAERFRKVFRRIEELGLLVFMHPDGFTEAQRFKDHYFANVIGNPLDTTVALHHLIFGGVLEDCPGLKLVAAHGGGYLPAYAGRIDHAASARRIPGRSSRKCPGHTCAGYILNRRSIRIRSWSTSWRSLAPIISWWPLTIRRTWARPTRWDSSRAHPGWMTRPGGRSWAATRRDCWGSRCPREKADPAEKRRPPSRGGGPVARDYARCGVCFDRNSATRALANVRADPVFHSGMNSQFGSSLESSSEMG